MYVFLPVLDHNGNEKNSKEKPYELRGVFTGKVESEEDLVIHGRVCGVVTGKAKVYILDTGNVEGVVIGEDICIAGHVRGQVLAKASLIVTCTANVDGNLMAKELFIEDGAHVNTKMQPNFKTISFSETSPSSAKPEAADGNSKAEELFIEDGGGLNTLVQPDSKTISFSEITLSPAKPEATEEADASVGGSEQAKTLKTETEQPERKDWMNGRLW